MLTRPGPSEETRPPACGGRRPARLPARPDREPARAPPYPAAGRHADIREPVPCGAGRGSPAGQREPRLRAGAQHRDRRPRRAAGDRDPARLPLRGPLPARRRRPAEDLPAQLPVVVIGKSHRRRRLPTWSSGRRTTSGWRRRSSTPGRARSPRHRASSTAARARSRPFVAVATATRCEPRARGSMRIVPGGHDERAGAQAGRVLLESGAAADRRGRVQRHVRRRPAGRVHPGRRRRTGEVSLVGYDNSTLGAARAHRPDLGRSGRHAAGHARGRGGGRPAGERPDHRRGVRPHAPPGRPRQHGSRTRPGGASPDAQSWVGKPRLMPPWLGSSQREVTTLPRVKKCTPSVPWAWVSPNSEFFQPPNE